MNDHPSLFRIYLQLMKLRVVVLLQITAICAILAHDLMVRSDAITGDRTWLETLEACLVTLLGGTLAAGGSNAINMVYDRDIDPGMSRTRTRPIPNGWISVRHSLIFGVTISVIVPQYLHSITGKQCSGRCSLSYSTCLYTPFG